METHYYFSTVILLIFRVNDTNNIFLLGCRKWTYLYPGDSKNNYNWCENYKSFKNLNFYYSWLHNLISGFHLQIITRNYN